MTIPQTNVPIFERPLVSTAVACELLGIKRTTLFRLLGLGALASAKYGSKRLICTASIRALADSWLSKQVRESVSSTQQAREKFHA